MRRTLHLVRAGATPVVSDGDWIVDLERLVLADRGTPPLPPGPLTHDLLVDLIVRADLVLTW